MAKMRWNFPSTNGGMEYVQDPSSAHFIEAPVSNLVREVIQNSLDARYDGLDKPVRVEFAEIYIDKSRIGGCELEQHVRACHERAEEKNRTAVVEIYQRALEVLEQAQVRCLMIQDTGTTGLKANLWDSLVREEGAVSKFGDNPGGNYGIGKNAVLNVSDLRTVFYSTRYIGRDSGNKGRVRGRIDKLQGKSTLMTHPDPNDPGDMVQHIGFYADEAGQPLVGARNIPKTFRLDDTGTGVYILGFNPRSDDWVMEIARAAAENFFYAIHNKDLVISVKPADGQEDIEIVHDTLEDLLENCDAKYYYRAIRDSMPRQTPKIDNLGALNAYVRFDKNAPRRVGYINRNGMLITDSREQKSNPLAPRGNSFWLDYAVMVMPATAEGDMWIRQIENPSHTALSAEQLPDKDAIRAAQRTFLEARRALTKIIDDESGINEPSELSNVEELARFFPKEDSSTKEEVLKVRSIERPRQATRLADPDGLEDESDAGDEYETWSQIPVRLLQADKVQIGMNTHAQSSGLGDWIPQTRNPEYLWQFYTNHAYEIVMKDQRPLAQADIHTMQVPSGLKYESFIAWIRTALAAAPFVDTVRQTAKLDDQDAWDMIVDQWGISLPEAARGLDTSNNWLYFFETMQGILDQHAPND